MARLARVVVPGLAHHITQRGNNRQDVFFVDADRKAYLAILREQSECFGLTLHGYCLMPNHVHLVATPRDADSLAKAVGRTHLFYSQYMNRIAGRSGHLWQGRFYSCALDEAHFFRALKYVEQNPVRAKMVRVPWRYGWSSAAAHVDGADSAGLLDMRWWKKHYESGDAWREEIAEPQDEKEISLLRLHLNRGRPLVSGRFLSGLEKTLGRRLRALPVGRPRKTKAARK